MEKSLFLNRLEGDLPEGYSRLYFGSEFCPWTLPAAEDILRARDAALKAGWRFTLATPVFGESSLEDLKALLQQVVPHLGEGDEVLVSDLGALALVRGIDDSLPVLLGRALSGQKRGPRILDLSLKEDQLNYFRKGAWYGSESVALLTELGINRVELDNLLQGLAPLPGGLAGSLHYPYAMVTSSRNCPSRSGPGAGRCGCTCGEVFTLSSGQSRLPLLQGGNTQFLENNLLPENLDELRIDRLVYHPRLPR